MAADAHAAARSRRSSSSSSRSRSASSASTSCCRSTRTGSRRCSRCSCSPTSSQTGTAFVAVVAGLLVAAGTLKGFLNEHHLHSLGKMVFACDRLLGLHLLLPVHADLVREHPRGDGLLPPASGQRLAAVLPGAAGAEVRACRSCCCCRARPSATPARLVPVSLLILFAQFWELYLMVGPAVGHGEEAAARAPAARRVRRRRWASSGCSRWCSAGRSRVTTPCR